MHRRCYPDRSNGEQRTCRHGKDVPQAAQSGRDSKNTEGVILSSEIAGQPRGGPPMVRRPDLARQRRQFLISATEHAGDVTQQVFEHGDLNGRMGLAKAIESGG